MPHAPWTIIAATLALAAAAHAQTGVSDDRVSLPAGPGSLEGIGENVSLNPNMGVMSFGVPIEVPQGFAGVTPNLRLGYSSGAGSSVVGVGWSLDVPHIERSTVFGLPRYTRDDAFTVDGSDELVELPGAPVPTYRARYEGGFVRYAWLDAAAGREGYWRAEYPDGRVATFGARADGTAVPAARVSGAEGTFRYLMVEMVDAYGHRMVYAYEKSGAVSLVRQIEYAFDDQGTARYAVGFGYAPRADDTGGEVLSDAKAGFDERLTVRLAAIDVFSGDDRIRRYELGYESYADSGGFTRLREVAVRGAQGGIYPAVQRFGYSQSLEGVCDDPAGCARPFSIDMGNIGVNVGVGRATLIDINGDALPDLVDTTDDGPHRFVLNTLAADGRPRFAAQAVASAIGVGSGFRLGTPFVQVLDVDGDGFADLLDARNGRALMNRGGGDWAALAPLADTASIGDALGADFEDGELRTLRFIDLDNDKRIDLLRSTRETTSVWFNLGADGFVEDEGIELLGYDLLVDDVQLADMNGDGLLDAARLNVGGLRYKLNLGHGRWGAEVDVQGLPIDESELDLATLDDINGDGLSDLVVVAGRSVRFALNRNGEDFAPPVLLAGDDIDGALPLRDATVTVLMADINGNGSTDIVWLDAEGQVTALELFPVRPNQLARVENSLGQLTEITYTTAVQQLAQDGAAQTHPLPHPMLVVDRIDSVDLLAGVRETTTYRYRDGYYDGIEKRFRGFGHVEMHTVGDDTQEDGRQIVRYDVGAEDPYRHGLLLHQQTHSAGRPLGEIRTTYEDCPLAEVPATTPAIRHICATATETRVIEGAAATEHVLLRQETVYDGYGNVKLAADLGVVETGAGACAPCDGSTDDLGGPCGSQCQGDEAYTETDYITPGPDTAGRWILGAPFRVASYGDPTSALRTESLIYYDGPAFDGLALGALTHGSVTRTTEKLDPATDAVITTSRYRHDAHGNIIESLDPLGEPGGADHRTLYTIDDSGLHVTAIDLLLTDDTGEPYRLRREFGYESLFDNIIEGTDWMRVDAAGTVRSARRSTQHGYDEFGRIIATARPGDSLDTPTEVYSYDLGSPLSRIVSRMRSQTGGPLDLETVSCLDGRGRTFQTRTRIDDGTWQVSGFSLFNVQGQPWRVHQPYTAPSGECDLAPPADSRFVELFRDATGRALTSTLPDAELYGAASQGETRYGPLTITTLDEEDSDPQSPHADTPLVRRTDGLGRLVAVERSLADGSVAITRTLYDGLGRVSGAIDADGNIKRQQHDLLGRIVQIDDPNKGGPTRMSHDDAGNLVQLEDPRGVVLRSRYDGQNRLVEQWDDADREGTRQRLVWDHDATCDADTCSNTAARPVRAEHPGLDGAINSERFGYDLRGRQTRVERVMQGISLAFDLQHDNADRLVAATFPGGRTLDYRYDAASRIVAIDGIVTAFEYDPRGQLRGMTYADGARTEQAYDPVLRLARRQIRDAAGETLQALDYTRDRAGNLLAIEDTATTAGPDLGARFEYDAWYRTIGADLGPNAPDGGERLTSTYDLVGNVIHRESSRDDTALQVGRYGYEGFGPNALTQAGGMTLAYDAAGNAVQRGAQTFEWDARGRLTTVSDDRDALLARYAYGLGHRRTVKAEGDSTTLYASHAFELRDGISSLYVTVGQNRLARIDDAALAAVALSDLAPLDQTDRPAPDGRIDAADAWVALAAAEGAIDAPADREPSPAGALLHSAVRRMFVDRGPEVTFLHHDHQGSIVMATDGDTGEVIGKRAFHATGAERSDGFGDVDVYGFTSQEHDAVTGLMHFEHRLLDPTTGRWMSPDPRFAIATASDLGNPAEALGAYGYVGDNYANVIDPDGLDGEGAKKGNGANADKAAKQTAKANKANFRQTLRKACNTCKASVRNVGKAVDWNLRRMAGDTTTYSTPELTQKVEKANNRIKTLTNPKVVKRVKQSLAVAKAAKGAAETALGAVELSAGDPIGALEVIGGVGEVADALSDLYSVSKLDPKNPADAAKLLADLPQFLEMAVKHYEAKVSKYNLALKARTEQQLLSTGLVPEPSSSAQSE